MRKLLLSAALLLAAGPSVQAQQAQLPQDKIDKLFRRLEKEAQYNGNVLVTDQGRVVFEKSYGMADLAKKKPLDRNSVFELASVSKQFTAAAILLLQQQGRLSIDDSLRRFFPQLPYNGITVRHLLHHTSGLPDYMTFLGQYGDTTKAFVDNNDVIAVMAKHKIPLHFQPGEKFEYSNTGYMMLGSIIEKVSGRSFGTYMEQQLFQPLGMNRTFIYRRRFRPGKVDNYAFGYVNDKGKYVLPDSTEENNYVIYLDGIFGDGTVNSTTGDLLKWDQALYGNRLFNGQTMQLMFEPGRLNNGKPTRYACGWIIDTTQSDGLAMSHGGGWPGYITYIVRHPEHRRTIILLRNKETELRSDQLAQDIELILLGKDAQYTTAPSVKVDEKILATYVGDFELRPGFVISVTREGAQLAVQATGQPKFKVYPKSQRLFFLKEVAAEVEFIPETNGSIQTLILHQGGRDMKGTRKAQ